MGSGTDQKRSIIHEAAIGEFSSRGYAGTSMANIADAAGMSRPALYQYFADKVDIFASAFVAIFQEHVANALEALAEPGTTADQLDGFLQRYEGDLWQRMAASPHLDEIAGAKSARVSSAITGEVVRLWDGMSEYLKEVAPGGNAEARADREGWLEVLQLSPKGFRSDQPAIDVYRRRLTALAHSVAAGIDAR